MKPKRQVIEKAIVDLRDQLKDLDKVHEKQLEGHYMTDTEEFMMEFYNERVNIANRLFVPTQASGIQLPNPNSRYYDPNPSPVFNVEDFHDFRRNEPLSYPMILANPTKYIEHVDLTIQTIEGFIKQLERKLKHRKDLQEGITMKLTEAKLKQMILDEMKSNLSAADRDQLYADIDLVRELTMDLDAAEKDKAKPGYVEPEEYDKREELILNRKRRIEAIAQKYNIRHYYDSPGNYDLINLMKKKFRRKSLEESKSPEGPLPHLDKITDLFAKSAEEGKQSASFVGSLGEYALRKDPIIKETVYSTTIGLRFKHLSQANEFYEALLPKLPPTTTARLHTYGQIGTVNIVYPNLDFFNKT